MRTRLEIGLLAFVGATLLQGCTSLPRSCRDFLGSERRTSVEAGRLIAIDSNPADETTRLTHLHCRADLGEQDAQIALASMYETGRGVNADLARAATLYEQAATEIPRTTTLYSPPVRRGGSGQLLLLNNRNARPASAEAQFRLGLMFIEGRGRERDDARGRYLIRLAAEAGHAQAQAWLRERQP